MWCDIYTCYWIGQLYIFFPKISFILFWSLVSQLKRTTILVFKLAQSKLFLITSTIFFTVILVTPIMHVFIQSFCKKYFLVLAWIERSTNIIIELVCIPSYDGTGVLITLYYYIYKNGTWLDVAWSRTNTLVRSLHVSYIYYSKLSSRGRIH